MIVRNLFQNADGVFPTTIVKMLLGRRSIDKFLVSFSKMRNQGTVYSEDVFSSHKKYGILKTVTSAPGFFKIAGWSCPEGISGPYLVGREIIFYNNKEKLLLIFTYFPLHAIEVDSRNDILVRELKSYVFDNVTPFENMNIFEEIELEDIMRHNSLTTRFSSNPNEILKIVRIYDEHRWEFLTKTSNKLNNREVNSGERERQ